MNLEELNLNEEQLSAVQKIIQSETDKVRTDYSRKLKSANDEIEKYRPKDKTAAELDMEQRISALEQREKEIATRERAMNLSAKLKEKELPEGLAKFLNVGEDVDSEIDEISQMFGEKFLSATNKPSTHATNKGISKQEFAQMGYLERTRLFQENPDLYNTLI